MKVLLLNGAEDIVALAEIYSTGMFIEGVGEVVIDPFSLMSFATSVLKQVRKYLSVIFH